jgi:hypothetical protein
MRLLGPFLLVVANAGIARAFSRLHLNLDLLMYAPALMVAAFTLRARHERRDALAYLKTLPVSPRLTGAVEFACDLAPPIVIGLIATGVYRHAAFTIPLLGLAALWGMAWSEGEVSPRATILSSLSLVLFLALLHRFQVVGTTLACLGIIGWLLLRERNGDELSVARRVTAEQQATQTSALPLGGSWLLLAHTLGGIGGLGIFVWSASMTFWALRYGLAMPTVLFPMCFGLSIGVSTAARLKGPAREFLLSRPIRRWSYFAPPVVLLLALLATPALAEWGQARWLSEAGIDAQIRAAVRWEPRDLRGEQDWRGFYREKLGERFGLDEVPDGSLEPNPVPRARPAYVPTATLRAATRVAWEGRQLRLALLTMTVVLFGFALTKGSSAAGGAAGPRRALAWMMPLVVTPLIVLHRFPRWVLFPLWPLLVAFLLAVALCWRSVASDDA